MLPAPGFSSSGKPPNCSRFSIRTSFMSGMKVTTLLLWRKVERGAPVRVSTRSICCAPSQACQIRALLMFCGDDCTNVPTYERFFMADSCMRSSQSLMFNGASAPALGCTPPAACAQAAGVVKPQPDTTKIIANFLISTSEKCRKIFQDSGKPDTTRVRASADG